jgi:protein-tyrosine phosphatase
MLSGPIGEKEIAPLRVAIEGGFNLRDMGGYLTMDGRRIKHGMLYRSGTMAFVSADARAQLISLGIKTICDLRRPNERRAQPTTWHEETPTRYWSRDYEETSGVLADVVRHGSPTAESMYSAMISVYRALPHDHAPAYQFLFDQLVAGEVPLLFNCAAGKDRTGLAAALVLHALGVPRETIFADYMLTNSADFSWMLGRNEGALQKLADRAPDVCAVLLSANENFLTAAFEEMDDRHGGIDRYLAEVLGVDGIAKQRLRMVLTDG